MKKIFKLIGIIALAAVIGFSMAACGGGGDDDDDYDPSSLNGVWVSGNDWQYTISGSTATISRISTDNLSTLWKSAVTQKLVKVGDKYLWDITSTDYLTWSAEMLLVTSRASSPNDATGTSSKNVTITLSSDGKSLNISGTDITGTWTRKTGGGGSGGGGGGGSGSLAGTTWKCTESYPGVGSVTYTLTFTSVSRVTLAYNMMGISDTYNGNYTVNGSSITVKWDAGYTGSGAFSVNGNRLTDDEGHIFIRQ